MRERSPQTLPITLSRRLVSVTKLTGVEGRIRRSSRQRSRIDRKQELQPLQGVYRDHTVCIEGQQRRCVLPLGHRPVGGRSSQPQQCSSVLRILLGRSPETMRHRSSPTGQANEGRIAR
jgi:hypothetical protein